jgi:hypothetical protein
MMHTRSSTGIEDLRLGLDRVAFARNVGLEPDPWQEDLLRSDSSRVLLNCSRQSGKSTISAVLAVHTALYEPGSLVLLLSRALRQSGELFKKCMEVYRALDPRPVAAESETALTLRLANDSRIVSLPGQSDDVIRGYSGVRLLLIDEAARVPGDLYLAVLPMLAVSGGRLIALSTPFGTRGWFYDAWVGSEPWERYQVSAESCPRIDKEFLAEMKKIMGEWFYRQEFFCEFLDAQTQAFRREDVDKAFEEEIVPWEL